MQSSQPDQTKNDGSSQPSLSKSTDQNTQDEITVDDEDEDDDLMFDEEEFDVVKCYLLFLNRNFLSHFNSYGYDKKSLRHDIIILFFVLGISIMN